MTDRIQTLLGLAGLLLVMMLVLREGAQEVFGSLALVRWWIVPICAAFGLFLLLAAISWQRLTVKIDRLALGALFRLRWIGNSINNLLPVAQVGGDLVRIRLLVQQGIPGASATASVVVDVTLAVLTQITFAGIGIVLWIGSSGWSETAAAALTGITLFALLIVGFFLAQLAGLFGRVASACERVVNLRRWTVAAESAEALDQAVVATYRHRSAMLQASAWRMLSWFAGALELWLILFALGHPVSPGDAVILESLGQAVRKAAFLVPGAVGIQEGGFMILGSSIGLPADTGLALSLVKRLRELLVGLPGIVAWRMGRRPLESQAAEPFETLPPEDAGQAVAEVKKGAVGG
jgi:putative membrane protein